MTIKRSYVTLTDQFCGAGGSSIGAVAAGAELVLALNHWKLAIETHASNFPDAAHDCTDISACDPRRYPSTDILITSPECTNHTLAKGKGRRPYRSDLFGKVFIDPSEERSRATMWDVPRFAEYHDYNLIIVENVVDASYWVMFDAWLHAMGSLGYTWKTVYFNSMFAHPTPQSRDRMYVVFWKKGNQAPDLNIRPRAYCVRCERDIDAVQSWKSGRSRGKYGRRGQYVYRCPDCAEIVEPYYYPAASAIDWQVPIERISERKRPLQPKTLERIRLGLERFGRQYLTVEVGYASGHEARPALGSWPTQTSRQSVALVEPGIVELRNHGTVRPLGQPVSTVEAGGNHHGLLMPFLTRHYSSSGNLSSSVLVPAGTVTSSDHHSLTVPPAFLTSYYGEGSNVHPVSEPLPTQPGHDKHALVVPFIVSRYNGPSRNPVHSVEEPLMTVPSVNPHHLAVPGEMPAVEDCGFRMLEPHEIGAAMAFPADYIVLGNKRDRVKQYGNAVTPPVMSILLSRCLETLGGEVAS